MSNSGNHGEGPRKPRNITDLLARLAERDRQIAALKAANAALVAEAGDDDEEIPVPFEVALASAQDRRHQAVMIDPHTVVVLGRQRPGNPAHAWRMTRRVLDGLEFRAPREITGFLPSGVEAAARRRSGKVAVAVSSLPETDQLGAARCALRALSRRGRLASVVAVPAGAAGAIRSHAVASGTAAAALAAVVVGAAIGLSPFTGAVHPGPAAPGVLRLAPQGTVTPSPAAALSPAGGRRGGGRAQDLAGAVAGSPGGAPAPAGTLPGLPGTAATRPLVIIRPPGRVPVPSVRVPVPGLRPLPVPSPPVTRHALPPVPRVVRHLIPPVTRIVHHLVPPVRKLVHHLLPPVPKILHHVVPPGVRKLVPPVVKKLVRHVLHVLPPLPSTLPVPLPTHLPVPVPTQILPPLPVPGITVPSLPVPVPTLPVPVPTLPVPVPSLTTPPVPIPSPSVITKKVCHLNVLGVKICREVQVP